MLDKGKLTEFEELSLEILRKISAQLDRRLNRHISGSQAMILWKLEKQGPLNITALADQMLITPGAVTSLSDKLIANGYANRTRVTKDRRVVNLEITDQGKELLLKIKTEMKQSITVLFAGLSDEDLEHLVRIYRQVLINLEEQKKDA